MTARSPATIAAALAATLLLAAAPAMAKGGSSSTSSSSSSTSSSSRGGGGGGGGGEIRVAGSCTAGVGSTLRLRSRDGQIRVDFELERHGRAAGWRIVLVHERRVEWRTSGSDGALEISHTVRDYAGPDQVAVIASGPGGAGCDASATLLGPTA
jgi:hypothetical protein